MFLASREDSPTSSLMLSNDTQVSRLDKSYSGFCVVHRTGSALWLYGIIAQRVQTYILEACIQHADLHVSSVLIHYLLTRRIPRFGLALCVGEIPQLCPALNQYRSGAFGESRPICCVDSFRGKKYQKERDICVRRLLGCG